MKFHHLRDVLAVAEHGSLRAAARHLDIAQPALTRSIRELERDLGATLFERQSRGVVVTPAGERFVRRAKAAQSELRRAREEVAQMQGGTRGTVAACLSSVPHVALLPHALRPFRERFPEVHLDVIDGVFPAIESSLRDGALDFYIGPVPGRLPGAGLLVEKLFDNTRVIVARKGHPLARARSLGELAGAEWITTSITHKADEELSPLFAQHGLPAPRLALQSHSALTFVVALVYSDLLMMLPVQWLDFALTREALRKINVAEPLPAPPICIVRRAGLPLTPAAEYFCDMIRRAAAHLVSGAPAKTRRAGTLPAPAARRRTTAPA